jgi:hypothetical protein
MEIASFYLRTVWTENLLSNSQPIPFAFEAAPEAPRSAAGMRQHYTLSTRGEGRGEAFVLLFPLLHLPKPLTPSACLFFCDVFWGKEGGRGKSETLNFRVFLS